MGSPGTPETPEDEGDLVQTDEDTLEVRRRPDRLGDVMSELVARRHWRDRLEGAGIFRVWEDVVGENLARRCEPVKLVGGRLVVRAENPAWATEVRYLTTSIVERANEVLRPGLVQRVDVVIGELRGDARGAGPGDLAEDPSGGL